MHNFVGKQTGILKGKKVENGFDVMVANGDKIITQQEEGIVSFNVPAAAAAHVAVFENMPNVILAAGPLVKAGWYIIYYTSQAKAIDKKTGKVILTAEFKP